VATNSGNGHRNGAVTGRYQLLNLLTDLWDIYDSNGNHLRQKKSPGPAKGIEKRVAVKPPRIK
jgi:hypothetical protein